MSVAGRNTYDISCNIALMKDAGYNETFRTFDHQAVAWTGSFFMGLLSFIIVLGNGVIIVSVAIVKKLREPANYLVVSLALSDFLVGLVVLPLTIVYDVEGTWVFGSMMCDVHVSFDVICCTASIMNLCMISIDRYFLITKPLTYPQTRKGYKMALAIAIAWTVSALIIIPALFGFTENVKDAPGWIGHPLMSVLEEGGDCGRPHISGKTMLSSSHCAKNVLDGDLSTYWNPGSTLTFRFNQSYTGGTPYVYELAIYGEKRLGKTCLISQELWFTIYSTVFAFYLPLAVMLFMYWKIYIAASLYHERNKRRSTCFLSNLNEMSFVSRSPSLFPLISSHRSSTSSSYNPGGKESSIDLHWKTASKTKSSYRGNHLQQYVESTFSDSVHFTKNRHSIANRSNDINANENLFSETKKNDDKQHSQNFNRFENDETATNFKLNEVDQRSFSPRKSHSSPKFRKLSAPTSAARAEDATQLSPIKDKTLFHCDLDKTDQDYATVHKFNLFPPICEGSELQNEENFETNDYSNTTVTKDSSTHRPLKTRSNSDASFAASKVFCRKQSSSVSAPTNAKSRKKYPFKRSYSTPDRPSSCNGSAALHSAQRNRSTSSSISRFSEVDDVFSIGTSGFRRKSTLLGSLRRRASSFTSRERSLNVKAIRTLGVIVGAFTFCWLPFFIVTFIRPFVCEHPESKDCMPLVLVRAVLWLGYLNSALNPFIYIGFSPHLRDSFKLLLKCNCTNIDRRLARSEFLQATNHEREAAKRLLTHRSIM